MSQLISKLLKVANDEAKCVYAFGEESGELDFDAAQKFCRSKVPPGNCQNCDSNIFVINNEEHHNLVNDNLVESHLINIDKTFILTHAAPTCGEILYGHKGEKTQHAERDRRLSQDKGLVNHFLIHHIQNILKYKNY